MRGERERGGREGGERERERERQAVRTFKPFQTRFCNFHTYAVRSVPVPTRMYCVYRYLQYHVLVCTHTFSGLGQPIPSCTEYLR